MKREDLLLAVAAQARHRGSLLTLDQAVSLGASRKVMAGLVRSGMFRRPYPGVFVLAGAAGHEVEVRAALAALGPAAVASHRSAAWLLGLVDRPPAAVQVTVRGGYSRRLPGVEVHRSQGGLPLRSARGVRCTEAARTLIDLATDTAVGELAEAVDRALARGLVGLRDLQDAVVCRRRGAAALRRCVSELGDLGRPESSVLELKMVRLLVRYGLPLPRVEAIAGPDGRYRIDFAYVERKLAVEVDGYTWHHSPRQMTRDQARRRALALEGWTVLVYSWRDVMSAPDRVAGEILAAHRALGAVRSTCSPR